MEVGQQRLMAGMQVFTASTLWPRQTALIDATPRGSFQILSRWVQAGLVNQSGTYLQSLGSKYLRGST